MSMNSKKNLDAVNKQLGFSTPKNAGVSTSKNTNLSSAAARRLSEQRKSLGLPEDKASQEIWQNRFAAGTHTEEDALKAMTKKANAWGEGNAYQSGTSSYAPQTNQRTSMQAQDTMQSADVVGDNFGENPAITQSMYDRFMSQAAVANNPNNPSRNISYEDAQPWENAGLSYTQALAAENQGLTTRFNPLTGYYEAQGGQFQGGGGTEGFRDDQRQSLLGGDETTNDQAYSGWTGGGGSANGGGGNGQGGAGGAGGQGAEGSGFGFDPQFNEQMNQINAQRAQLDSQEEQMRRRMAEDAQQAELQGRELRDDQLTANTERMADGGMVHSGINIQAQADIGEDYMKFNDQIQRARARGEEDLAQQLTGQRNQLMAQEGIARQERAAREAAERELKDMQDAIANTPMPTVAGRYELNIPIAEGVGQQHASGPHGNDAKFFDDPNRLANRIEAIFDNRNVSLVGHGNETDFQRLARIVQEVSSGKRDLNDVRNSVERLAGIQNI